MKIFNPSIIKQKSDISSEFQIYENDIELVNQRFNTIATKYNGGRPTVNFDKINSLTVPNLFSVMGEDSLIIWDDVEISVKSFFYYRYLDYILLIIQTTDGRVIDINNYDVAGNISVSLSPYSKQYSAISSYKKMILYNEVTVSKKAILITEKIIDSLIYRTFRHLFFKFLKTLNQESMKLLYRARSFDNSIYNKLNDDNKGLYRRQFLTAFPSTSFLLDENANNNEWVEKIDNGESGIQILNDYFKTENKHAVKFVMSKTPHALLKIKPIEALPLLSGIDSNFWPKKKKEWPYLVVANEITKDIIGVTSTEHNKVINGIAKKYKIGAKGWIELEKFGTAKFLRTSFTDFIRDVLKNTSVLNLADITENSKNVIQSIQDKIYEMFKKLDFERIIELNNLFHNTVNRAMSEAEHIVNLRLKGYISVNVTELPLTDKFVQKIKTNYGITIKQLISEEDFKVEGKVMQHCVRGYYGVSLKGHNPIFSLYKNDKERSTLELQIQLKNDEARYSIKVHQHRSVKNATPVENCITVAKLICEYFQHKDRVESINKGIEEGKTKFSNNDNYELKNHLTGACIINMILYPFLFKENKEIIVIDDILNKFKF